MNTKQPSCEDIHEPGLMHMNDALNIIQSQLKTITGIQRISIEQAHQRILAEDIIAPFNVPPHANSAVDGYAFRHADQQQDAKTQLSIVGTVYAGQAFQGNIDQHACVRIMTGAKIPAGLDTVIMQEHTQKTANHIVFTEYLKAGQNVRNCGEDIQSGQVLLHSGRLLQAADIGILASIGKCEINVRRKLCIALASTGDELIDAGTIPSTGTIFDSNRYSLTAALNRPYLEVIDLGIVQDKPEQLLETFTQAAEYADLIISSGGVSVGDADYTKNMLQHTGNIDFWKVAIKPGRPLAFGHLSNSAFFGLPGNPVAVLVTFYLFVLPALDIMLNIKDRPISPKIQAKCSHNLRKKPGRSEVQRGILEQSETGQWTVKNTGKQGSGILTSMSQANAFIFLEHERAAVEAGEYVTVLPFSGFN